MSERLNLVVIVAADLGWTDLACQGPDDDEVRRRSRRGVSPLRTEARTSGSVGSRSRSSARGPSRWRCTSFASASGGET